MPIPFSPDLSPPKALTILLYFPGAVLFLPVFYSAVWQSLIITTFAECVLCEILDTGHVKSSQHPLDVGVLCLPFTEQRRLRKARDSLNPGVIPNSLLPRHHGASGIMYSVPEKSGCLTHASPHTQPSPYRTLQAWLESLSLKSWSVQWEVDEKVPEVPFIIIVLFLDRIGHCSPG